MDYEGYTFVFFIENINKIFLIKMCYYLLKIKREIILHLINPSPLIWLEWQFSILFMP